MKLKNLSMIFSYLSDVTLIAWLYFQATNFQNFAEKLGKSMDSPDFQIQFYQVLIQSLTFALLLFLAAQSVVYILAWRKFRSAFFYLKYFSVLGFAISLFIVFQVSAYALLPVCIYLLGYYVSAKTFKELTAVAQSPRQPSTPQ